MKLSPNSKRELGTLKIELTLIFFLLFGNNYLLIYNIINFINCNIFFKYLSQISKISICVRLSLKYSKNF